MQFIDQVGSTFYRPQSLRIYHCTSEDKRSIVAPGSSAGGKLENHYFDGDLFPYESQIDHEPYTSISDSERNEWFNGAKEIIKLDLHELINSHSSNEITLFDVAIFGEVAVRPLMRNDRLWLFRDRHPIAHEWNPILDLSFHSNSFGTYISGHTYSNIWSEFTNEYDHVHECWMRKDNLDLTRENVASLVHFFQQIAERLGHVKWKSYVECEIPGAGEILREQLSAMVDNA